MARTDRNSHRCQRHGDVVGNRHDVWRHSGSGAGVSRLSGAAVIAAAPQLRAGHGVESGDADRRISDRLRRGVQAHSVHPGARRARRSRSDGRKHTAGLHRRSAILPRLGDGVCARLCLVGMAALPAVRQSVLSFVQPNLQIGLGANGQCFRHPLHAARRMAGAVLSVFLAARPLLRRRRGRGSRSTLCPGLSLNRGSGPCRAGAAHRRSRTRPTRGGGGSSRPAGRGRHLHLRGCGIHGVGAHVVEFYAMRLAWKC